MNGAISKDLTTGSVAKQLLCFIGPLFISNILQTVYNIVDMAVVGHFVGKTGLSAVSGCGEIMNILLFIALGISNAGQVLTAQYTGANRPEKTRELIGGLFSVLTLIALSLTLASVLMYSSLLDFANIPDEARGDAQSYLLICAVGLFFTYGYNMVGAVLRGMGDSWHPFIFMAVASLLNVGLDMLFVAALGMGVAGAAAATVCAQMISFVCSIVFLYFKRNAFGFDFKRKSFAIRKSAAVPLLKLGIPIAMQYGFVQLGKIIVTRWINDYGVDVSAITGIGNKFNSIGLTFSGAVGTSAAAMIGQCIGAGKYDRVRQTMVTSGVISLGIACVLSAMIFAFPIQIFSIFTTDDTIIDITEIYVPVIAVMLFSSAFRAPMNGLINGTGNPRMNFVIAVTDGIIGHIGLAMVFGFVLPFGVQGLWYGNAAAGFIPFLVGLVYYCTGGWKRHKTG